MIPASVLLTNCIQESLYAVKLNLSVHLGLLAYQVMQELF